MSANNWLTKQEAAAHLGIAVRTLERMIDRGEIPARRLSKRAIRIPASALDPEHVGSPLNEWAARENA